LTTQYNINVRLRLVSGAASCRQLLQLKYTFSNTVFLVQTQKHKHT